MWWYGFKKRKWAEMENENLKSISEEQISEVEESIERCNVMIEKLTKEVNRAVFYVYIADEIEVTKLENLNKSIKTLMDTGAILNTRLTGFKNNI